MSYEAFEILRITVEGALAVVTVRAGQVARQSPEQTVVPSESRSNV